MNILGLSAYYHDAAAALLCDGALVAAAQEERFTRKKHDERFPRHAVQSCLARAGLTVADLDVVVFYEKPLLKFERLLHTYLHCAPRGFRSFYQMMQTWMGQKLFLRDAIIREMAMLAGVTSRVLSRSKIQWLFTGHHESHAASAFYPSQFQSAAVLTIDGVGEWATASIARGDGNQLEIVREMCFPHSLGLLYSAFTQYLGFRVNSGEYKVMGLAPYGEPTDVDRILSHLVDLYPDGSFRMHQQYFDYCTGRTMTNRRFHALFGAPPREPESALTQRHMDLARSIQVVTEEIMLRMARHAHQLTGERNLCLAGGVALNCVGNGRILREGPFDDLWIQPAAGDAGGAVGAAYVIWHRQLAKPRVATAGDGMRGGLLGAQFSAAQITCFLDRTGIPYQSFPDDQALCDAVAQLLMEGHIVGWFQDAMEFGPRALGNRSILGNPCLDTTQATMNLKIKFRESFRPFAPVVLEECVQEYFDLARPSPYMLLVAPVAGKRLRELPDTGGSGLQRLYQRRSEIPAVTHVDNSARVQTVNRMQNPKLHMLLRAFQQCTGHPVLVNTSFNVRGEPIVCSHEDAYRCFLHTEMDHLVLDRCLLSKREQPALHILPRTLRQRAAQELD